MLPLIPAPLAVRSGDGAPFRLVPGTTIAAPATLAPVVAVFLADLEALTGVVLTRVDEGAALRLTLDPDDPDLAALPVAAGVRADGGDPADERYILSIADGVVDLRAAAPEGSHRGLTTLLQLAALGRPDAGGAIALPTVEIRDAPRFAWRGLSVDVARGFLEPQELRRVIDLLALYKANVLHLHLTDAEGWRLEIEGWPRLTAIGAQPLPDGRPGGFYTQAEYRDLVAYAAERFITVVPEIEMPGHAGAVFRSYPELAGDGAHAPDLDQPSHLQAMHPDNPRLMPFLADVLREVAALSPGAFMHIGGDEAIGIDAGTYRRFIRQAMPLVHAAGKQVVAWQEVARAGFAPGDVAQLWISPDHHDALDLDADPVAAEFAGFQDEAPHDLDRALAQGARILISQQSRCYLDTDYREPSADPAQEADHRRLGAPFYTPSTIAGFYDWDPATIRDGLDVTHIAGVEAAIWGESVASLDDLCFMVLPRLPGVLEKGWSPPAGDDGWAAYAPRLVEHPRIWDTRGWRWFRSSILWSAPGAGA